MLGEVRGSEVCHGHLEGGIWITLVALAREGNKTVDEKFFDMYSKFSCEGRGKRQAEYGYEEDNTSSDKKCRFVLLRSVLCVCW